MNKQEAIKWFEALLHYLAEDECNEDARAAANLAIDALRGPQPDPITGLVPCRGCEGSYVQSRVCDYGERTGRMSKTGTHIKSHPYLVGCTKCRITVSVFPSEAKTRGYTSAKECAEDLWNRAMGYKPEVRHDNS